jgi:hypothetical protein
VLFWHACDGWSDVLVVSTLGPTFVFRSVKQGITLPCAGSFSASTMEAQSTEYGISDSVKLPSLDEQLSMSVPEVCLSGWLTCPVRLTLSVRLVHSSISCWASLLQSDSSCRRACRASVGCMASTI